MELAYAQFLLNSLNKPFVWGQHDCVLFAVEAIRIRTGRNLLDVPVTWSTALEAHRVLQDLGGLRKIVSDRLGEPSPIIGASIGDIALVQDTMNNNNELLGVFHSQQILCPSANGLARLPISAAICRWKVQR